MSLHQNLEISKISAGGRFNKGLKRLLTAVAREPSMLEEQANVDLLTHAIGVRLCNMMLLTEDDIDMKESLSTFGMDPLVTIEIRKLVASECWARDQCF